MLSLKNVTKEYSGKRAVDSVNFEVQKGEVVGFLGPNGAGKTTTMRMIATLLDPDEGEIMLDDKNIREHSFFIRQKLGFMPENNPLYDDMLTSEYLNYVADLKELKGNERLRAIDEAVKETGIAEVFYKPISELSKGYKQRVGLAQAIMHKPDILILDEPTEGLDPNQRVGIRNLIKGLGKDRTIILSTHVLQEVTAMCSRVIIINQGKIVADGTTDELIRKAQGKRLIRLGAQGLTDTSRLAAIEGIESVTEKERRDAKGTFELSVVGEVDPRLYIFDLANQEGWKIWELHQEQLSLEDVFRELTVEEKQ